MVGNGYTNWAYDTSAAYLELAYWHSFISDDFYFKAKASKCSLSDVDPLPIDKTALCQNLTDEFETMIPNINIYNVIDNCY